MATVEHRVAALADLPENGMRGLDIAGRSIILARTGDRVTALSAFCTHFGAPLAEGVVHDGRIVCPWHHACFDAGDGRPLDPPALDGLKAYDCRLDGGDVYVRLPPRSRERVTPAAAPSGGDGRRMVIVGAGAAGAAAAESLRQRGFAGRITLISAEAALPYDRTLLSKEILQGIATPAPSDLRPASFYAARHIELRLGRRVVAVDADARSLTLDDGSRLGYDACLLATGGRPRRLDVPGAELDGVVTLRSPEDVDRILRAAALEMPVVVIGASFIAMECAASLQSRGCPVTVLAPEPVPFARLFGERVGRALKARHERTGTRFVTGEVARFDGQGAVEAVVTAEGGRLPAGLAIVGIGVLPATSDLRGLSLAEDGSVPVDGRLQALPDLFAAGDIARFPEPVSGATTRIEHWRLAQEHGRLAAGSMLGEQAVYDGVPFFWSTQHWGLYYAGHTQGFDDVVFDGAPEQDMFLAYYVKDGRVPAVLGVSRNTEMAALGELLRLRRMPDSDRLRQGGFDPVQALRASGEA
ncbi:FAD-dependent oxidoreductase [Marinivivus vitaminiproducens]|uniref:FAD-dependent oxidoreductase n=1 Tax=Marinivivus vitaminiproducens TaxID=3035935 RepID=UPI00279CD5BB|nr:FAD-dependent oxidoreductase [Geminicoccaceae bacterium SCSIO 64248]